MKKIYKILIVTLSATIAPYLSYAADSVISSVMDTSEGAAVLGRPCSLPFGSRADRQGNMLVCTQDNASTTGYSWKEPTNSGSGGGFIDPYTGKSLKAGQMLVVTAGGGKQYDKGSGRTLANIKEIYNLKFAIRKNRGTWQTKILSASVIVKCTKVGSMAICNPANWSFLTGPWQNGFVQHYAIALSSGTYVQYKWSAKPSQFGATIYIDPATLNTNIGSYGPIVPYKYTIK